LKTFERWALRTTLSLLLLLWLSTTAMPLVKVKAVSQNQAANQGLAESPIRLMIPSISVNAAIQYVGVDDKKEMETPTNSTDVGWFDLGVLPGKKGSAVIDGHFDDQSGEAGVFFNLYKLKPGDKVYLTDSSGQTLAFAVRESRLYDPGNADFLFSRNDSSHLNLITCDGVWDGTKKSYSKRLVVFTDKIN